MLEKLIHPLILQEITTLLNDKELVFIIRNTDLIELENLSNSSNSVLFDGSVLQKNDILLHTHYAEDSPATLSDQDFKVCEQINKAMLLYHTGFKQWDYYSPMFPHPYPLKVKFFEQLKLQDFLGLKYNLLRCNCYSLIRNAAKALYEIDYPYINYTSHNAKKVFKNPELYGFEQRLNDLELGDILLLYLSKEIPFHVALVVNKQPLEALHIYTPENPSQLISIESIKNNIVSVWTLLKKEAKID